MDTAVDHHVDSRLTGNYRLGGSRGVCINSGGEVSKKLFFSLEDVDFNDDASIDAFAHLIWAKATAEFTKDEPENPKIKPHTPPKAK